MKTITVTHLRAKLKYYLDQVTSNFETLIIPRSGEDDGVVIMSLKEYNSWQETMYLLSTKANRKELLDSIEQVEKGETVIFDPDADHLQ
jgi:antitoxin YefM